MLLDRTRTKLFAACTDGCIREYCLSSGAKDPLNSYCGALSGYFNRSFALSPFTDHFVAPMTDGVGIWDYQERIELSTSSFTRTNTTPCSKIVSPARGLFSSPGLAGSPSKLITTPLTSPAQYTQQSSLNAHQVRLFGLPSAKFHFKPWNEQSAQHCDWSSCGRYIIISTDTSLTICDSENTCCEMLRYTFVSGKDDLFKQFSVFRLHVGILMWLSMIFELFVALLHFYHVGYNIARSEGEFIRSFRPLHISASLVLDLSAFVAIPIAIKGTISIQAVFCLPYLFYCFVTATESVILFVVGIVHHIDTQCAANLYHAVWFFSILPIHIFSIAVALAFIIFAQKFDNYVACEKELIDADCLFQMHRRTSRAQISYIPKKLEYNPAPSVFSPSKSVQ